MKILKNELRVSTRDLRWLALFIGITWICGVALMLVIGFLSDAEYTVMGVFFALMGILIGIMSRRNLNPHNRLRMAVCMGETRRAFLAVDALITALETALALVAVFLLGHLELLLYRMVFPDGKSLLQGLGGVYRLSYVIFFILVMVVFNLFLTAVMNRFGVAGFLVIWLPFCLLLGIRGPALESARNGGSSLMAQLGRLILWIAEGLALFPWQLVAAFLLAAVAGVSLLLLRRCEVRL